MIKSNRSNKKNKNTIFKFTCFNKIRIYRYMTKKYKTNIIIDMYFKRFVNLKTIDLKNYFVQKIQKKQKILIALNCKVKKYKYVISSLNRDLFGFIMRIKNILKISKKKKKLTFLFIYNIFYNNITGIISLNAKIRILERIKSKLGYLLSHDTETFKSIAFQLDIYVMLHYHKHFLIMFLKELNINQKFLEKFFKTLEEEYGELFVCKNHNLLMDYCGINSRLNNEYIYNCLKTLNIFIVKDLNDYQYQRGPYSLE